MLKFYNSLTKELETFVPEKDKTVKIYVCGITPYDTTHLGHAATYVFFDVLVRYLTYIGYKVDYTQNVTDIDDDLLKRAKKVGQNWKDLGDFWTDNFLSDMKNLNVLPPTHFVRATSAIDVIEGVAYKNKGNVYFDTAKYPEYGKLSHYSQKYMERLLCERGGNPYDRNKRNPLDFILWQKAEGDEPEWAAPFGPGRPGWHIECSAMVYKYLGERIDIHGGGRDLIYPHHESEIAQSESFTGKKPYVKYWLHTGMLRYKGEKMSKSIGNLVLVGDLLKLYSAKSIRFLLLSHNFQYPWEFTQNKIKRADILMDKLCEIITNNRKVNKGRIVKALRDQFITLMDNNMDLAGVLRFIETTVKKLDKKNSGSAADISYTLSEICQVLGFTFED